MPPDLPAQRLARHVARERRRGRRRPRASGSEPRPARSPIASAPRRSPAAPGRSVTAATGVSPQCASATPKTATSATASCRTTTSSMSRGIHVHPARDDQVLLPVDEVEEAVLVHVPEIARVHPAVPDRLRRQVGALVVAGHRDRPPADDLPHLARRQILAVARRRCASRRAEAEPRPSRACARTSSRSRIVTKPSVSP